MSVAGRFRASARRTRAVARKEMRQLVRDRWTLAMVVGMPAIQLVLFGYAINLDVRNIPTGLLDRSRTALSRELVGKLEATQTFRIVRQVERESEAFELLERSRVGAVIAIPPDLDRRLHRGRGAEISILADASNPTVASAVASSGNGLGRTLARRYSAGGASNGPRAVLRPPGGRETFGPTPDIVRREPIQVAVIPLYNPERRTGVFIVPGLVGVILTMTMMLMTALAVVRERERGTFEFLIATPVGRTEVMVGKILPYVVVGLIQMALVLGLGRALFAVPLHGSLLELALGSFVFIGAMLMMGMLISSAATTQFQAMQMSFFFFMPSILLSGFMFPFESMPRVAQWIGEILPLTHFLRIVRGILLKGAPLVSLWLELAAIGAFLAVALVLATATFRKRLG